MIKIEHREEYVDGKLRDTTYWVGRVDENGLWELSNTMILSKEGLLDLKAELAKIEIK